MRRSPLTRAALAAPLILAACTQRPHPSPSLPIGLASVRSAGPPAVSVDPSRPTQLNLRPDHRPVPAIVIDTRDHPRQITPFDATRTRLVKERLPPHTFDKSIRQGPPNGLVPDGDLRDDATLGPPRRFPGIGPTGWIPSDATLAVGPRHIVSTVNQAIGFHEKKGTLLYSAHLGSPGTPGFFEPAGAGDFTFDPVCFYHHTAGRFFVLALEVYAEDAWITIGVSDDDNPVGVWYLYRTPAAIPIGDSTYWPDFPGFAYDDQAVYVTANLFKLQGPGGGWGGVIFRSFDLAPLLNGQPAAFTDYRDGSAATVRPAQVFGGAGHPYFVSIWSSTQIRVQTLLNPLTDPSPRSKLVSVPPFAGPPGDAPNGQGGALNTGGAIGNAFVRDGMLYTTHGADVGGRGGIRWYQIDLQNWPDSGQGQVLTLTQSGTIDPGGAAWTFFPAIAANRRDEVAVVFGQSGPGEYASMQIAARRVDDPPGTLGAPAQFGIGAADATGRWGDYFGIAVDPLSDSVFWGIGQVQFGFGWQTVIGHAQIGCPGDLTTSTSPADPAFGVPDGRVDSQDFFVFLDWFAGHDPRADLTGSADPNSPGYGVPDGRYDASDFFYYLDRFVLGCA